eukprot:CCRYP_018314-RA/>CCRYP_018314-RA protein AED:0.39 eAED:0.42 QI:0/0/0/1/1/1/2/0/77
MKESGLGYFDEGGGGEEDAWLDGGVGGDDEEEGNVTGPGGLDSTSIWKPERMARRKKPTKTSKYVNEDDTQEEVGDW